MKHLAFVLLAGTLFTWGARAQSQAGAQAGASGDSTTSVNANKSGAQAANNSSGSSSAQAGQNSAQLANGTAMQAVLSQPVDAKKNKPGDTVTAKNTQAVKSDDGQVIVPKGSKLVGHVTEAKARGKGESESALGIAFDKAILKNGQEVPLNATIQALAAGETAASSSFDEASLSGGGGAMASGSGSRSAPSRGGLGGVTSTAGGAVGAAANTAGSGGGAAAGTTGNVGSAAGGALNSTAGATGSATAATSGAVGGLNSAGQFASNSRGVFGLNGLNLSSAASNGTQGSLITSADKNVHLDSGTRMLLVAQGQADGQAEHQGRGQAKGSPEPRPERREKR
jgi:hypothetical protein